MKKLTALLRKPSAAELAQAELDEARRELLEAQTGRDYATAMVDYHSARIARLEGTLREVSSNA